MFLDEKAVKVTPPDGSVKWFYQEGGSGPIQLYDGGSKYEVDEDTFLRIANHDENDYEIRELKHSPFSSESGTRYVVEFEPAGRYTSKGVWLVTEDSAPLDDARLKNDAKEIAKRFADTGDTIEIQRKDGSVMETRSVR